MVVLLFVLVLVLVLVLGRDGLPLDAVALVVVVVYSVAVFFVEPDFAFVVDPDSGLSLMPLCDAPDLLLELPILLLLLLLLLLPLPLPGLEVALSAESRPLPP